MALWNELRFWWSDCLVLLLFLEQRALTLVYDYIKFYIWSCFWTKNLDTLIDSGTEVILKLAFQYGVQNCINKFMIKCTLHQHNKEKIYYLISFDTNMFPANYLNGFKVISSVAGSNFITGIVRLSFERHSKLFFAVIKSKHMLYQEYQLTICNFLYDKLFWVTL